MEWSLRKYIEILYLGIIIYKIAILTINEPTMLDNLINQMYLYKILAHVMIHFMSIIAIEFFMRHDKIFFLCHLCAKSKVYMFGLLWSTHLTKIFFFAASKPSIFPNDVVSCQFPFGWIIMRPFLYNYKPLNACLCGCKEN